MGRLLNIVLIVLGATAAVVGVLAALLLTRFDPNDYRGAIAEAVQRETGRTLELRGDLSLSLWPCCAIAAGPATLSNPPGFPAGETVRVDALNLGMQLWPLITRREVIVGGVRVDGLELDLVQRADGTGNWEFESAKPKTDAQAGSSDDAGAQDLPTFAIDSITVTNATLRWRDLASGDEYQARDIAIQAGPIRPGEAFDIEAGLVVVAEGNELTAAIESNAVSYEAGSGDVSVDALTVQINGLGVTANIAGALSYTAESLSGSGSARIERFSPRELLKKLGEAPVTADPAALGQASAAFEWQLSKDSLNANGLTIRIDDTAVSGTAGLTGFTKPRYRFKLKLDALDVDRYLAPVAEPSDSTGAATAAAADPLPVDALRDLQLDGTLSAGRLTVSDLRLDNFSATIAAKGDQLRVAPMQADIYGGTVSGQVTLAAAGDALRLGTKQQFDKVDASKLLGDFADERRLEGQLKGALDVTGSGKTADALEKSLSGTVAVDLANGRYRGVDLWHEITRARARIRGKPEPAAPQDPQTRINKLSIDGRLAGTRIASEKIVAEIPFLRMTGGGTLDWLTEALNYRFDAKVLSAPELENGEVLTDLENLVIPVTVTGSTSKPKIGVEFKSLAKNVAKEKLRDKLLDVLGGDEKPSDAPSDAPADQAAPEEESSPRDQLKRGLRDLLKKQ